MRPTWHFISAEDIYWMLDLTAPHIKASMRSRDKALELSDAVYKKSNSIIEKFLSAEVALTREELEMNLKEPGSIQVITDCRIFSSVLNWMV